MDKDIERIREAALDLDTEKSLRESLEDSDPSVMEANYQEAQRRADAYDRGEIESVDLWEALERVRSLLPR